MPAIVAPLPQFFDLTGAPLEGGYVHIGTAGGNPETSPVSVFWDVAMTQPAAQPLRTSRGYVARSGAPAAVYVAGAYSLTVKQRDGVRVLYAPTSVEFDASAVLREELASSATASKGAGQIGFSRLLVYPPDTVGQIIRDSVRRSLLEFMTPAQKADVLAGTLLVDCTAAVQAAFDSGEPLDGVVGAIRLDGAIVTGVVPNFVGRGKLTRFHVYTSTGVALELLNNAPGSFDDGLILRDFKVIGTATGTATGLKIEGAVWANSMVENVHVRTMGGVGFDFDDCLTLTARNIKAQGCGSVGIQIRQSNGITLIHPSAESNGSHGIYLTDDGVGPGENTGFTIIAPHVEENEGQAIYIRNRRYGTVLGGWVQVKGAGTRGALYVENSLHIHALGVFLTTAGDITNLAGVYADGSLYGNYVVQCGGFAANRNVVANTGSGRNVFSGTGDGSQGELTYTDVSSTGNTYQHWCGPTGNFGPVITAPYHSWNVGGTEKLALTAGGLRLVNHTNTTSATAGGASALPALPQGYVTININGTDRKIPYYQ